MLPVRPSSPFRLRLAFALPAALLLLGAGTPPAAAQTSVAEAALPAAPLPDAPLAQQSAAPAPAASSSQTTSSSAHNQAPHKPDSEEVLRQEEHQRILGVVPNFNTVESAANVPPLSPGQKFHLAFHSTVDPFVFVADAFVAGIGQGLDSHSKTTVTVHPDGKKTYTRTGFGQGASGYFQRFGSSYADTADGTLWGNAILPVLLKEDPRYFRMGTGSFKKRFLYSARTAIWCRRDNGTWGPNYANMGGNFIAGGISNAYYPAEDRGFGQTISGAAIVTAEGAIGAEFYEFWPDISKRLFRKRHLNTPAH